MNNKSLAVAKRISELFIDGTWIAGTNFKMVLEDVDYIAANKNFESINSIAALTFHVDYYLQGINEVFQGKPLSIRDKFSFDAPEITNEVEWKNRKQKLYADALEMIRHVEKMDDAQLESDFANMNYGSVLRNIEGMIEHGYYHLGQIIIIKKLI